MPLPTNRVTGDTVQAADINAIATEVNELAVVREAPLNVQDPDYGADPGNSAATNDTAFAAWLTALNGAAGAEGFIPPGNYNLSAAWNMDDFTDVSIRGAGPRCTPPVAGGGGPQLIFTQSGSADLISLDEARSVNIEGVRIVSTHDSFTGKMVNLDSAATDAQFITFNYVGFYGANDTARNVAALVSLDRVNTITFRECGFYDGQIGVQGHHTTFAIAVNFDGCTFQNNVTTHVRNGGENWKFDNCIFEPLSNGKPGAFNHAAGVYSVGLHFDGCWFGDVSVGTGTPAWITVAGDNFTFTRNEMYAETAGSKHIVIDENNVAGLIVMGNTFHGAGTPAVDYGSTSGHTTHCIGPNFINTGVTEVGGTPPATLVQQTAFGTIYGGSPALGYAGATGVLELSNHFRLGGAVLLGSATGSGGQYIEGWEQSADPAAPSANAGRLFFKDNGAGKTQLCVRFSSGATQVIATQP